MRLTIHSDYAMRLLMLLAVERQQRHTVGDIARRYDISRNHLTKVAQTLAAAGFVHSTRGRGGGLHLGFEPSDINLGAVIRATEDNLSLVECFDRGGSRCIISSVCGLRDPLQRALAAFLAVLDASTLADLVGNSRARHRMRHLLGNPLDPVAARDVRRSSSRILPRARV